MKCKNYKYEIGSLKNQWIPTFSILAVLVNTLNISCGGKLKQDRRKLFHSENKDHSVPQISIKPQVAIIFPTENSYISMKNDSPNFEISGICPEPRDLLSENVNINVDGQSIENSTQCTAGVFHATFDSTQLSEGVHTFFAQMKDIAGQSLNSQSVLVKKDTQVPQFTLQTPGDLKIMSSFVNGKVIFSGTCLDSENEVQIEVLGSSEQSRSASCATGVWTTELDFSGADEGSLIYVVSLKDDAGNEKKLQQTLINDITPPAAPKKVLLYSDKTDGIHTTLSFSPDILISAFNTSETPSVQYRLVRIDNTASPLPTVPIEVIGWTDRPMGQSWVLFRLGGLTLLDLTSYAIEARAIDLVGNISATTSSAQFFTQSFSQSPFSGFDLDGTGVLETDTLTGPFFLDSKNIYPRSNPYSARNLIVQGQVKYRWQPALEKTNNSFQQTAAGHSAIFINTKNLDLQMNAQFLADGFDGTESNGFGYTNIGGGASGGGASGADGGSAGGFGFANPKFPLNTFGAPGGLLFYNPISDLNFFPFGMGGSGGAGLGRLNCVVGGFTAVSGIGGIGGPGGGGGGGGSSGYCFAGFFGGGGGGGAGLIVIESHRVTGTAMVRAKGGEGGPDITNYGLHPGGGGGGGTVWLASKIYGGNYFVNVSGGAGVQNGTAGQSLVFQINSDGSYTKRLASDSWTIDSVAVTNELPFAISQLPDPKISTVNLDPPPLARISTIASLQSNPTLVNKVNISGYLSYDLLEPNAIYIYLDELIMAPGTMIDFNGKKGQNVLPTFPGIPTTGGDGGFGGAAGGYDTIGGSGGTYDKLAGNPPIASGPAIPLGEIGKSWAFKYINSEFEFGLGGNGGDALNYCTGTASATTPRAMGGLGGVGAGGGGAGGAGCPGLSYYGASGGGGGGLIVIVANKISLSEPIGGGFATIRAKGGAGGDGVYVVQGSLVAYIGAGGGGGGGVVWIATKSYIANTLYVNVKGGKGGNSGTLGGLDGTDGTARIFQILPFGKLVERSFEESW